LAAVPDGTHEGAAELLVRSVSLEPRFGWGWYELCRCYFQLKDHVRLAEAALGFAVADRVQLFAPHIQVLTDAANFLFEKKLREEPFGIYSILLDQGCTDDLVRTRHAEYFIWKQDFQKAIDLLKPHWEERILGDWGVRALAQAYRELGEFESAAAILAAIVRQNPRNLAFARDYLSLLYQQNRQEDAAEFLLHARDHFSDRAYLELKTVSLSETGEYRKLLEILSQNPQLSSHSVQTALDRAIVGCAYKVRDFPVTESLIEQRISRFGLTDHIMLCRLNVAFGSRNWPLVKRYLSEVPQETLSRSLEFRIRHFEYCCHAGLVTEAERILASLEPISQLPRKFLLSVLRFHGERGDWTAVTKVGMDALDHNFDFAETGHLLSRAIRKTSASRSAILRIDQLLGVRRTTSLIKLRIAISDDGEDAVCNDLQVKEAEECLPMCQRLIFGKLVRGIGVPKVQVQQQHAIYYCTDAGYLGPSLVSLLSLIDSNPELLANVRIYLLTEGEIATELAQRAIARFAAAPGGTSICLLSKDEVMQSRTSLKTSYGMFTGGESLAEACYYRIFVAKYLRELGEHETALYIDSDTIVHGQLSELFRSRPKVPLCARLEVSRPEVALATARHGLEPGRYFNSGVLYFDLKHRDIETALDRTLSTVHDDKDQLIFQDQCALNIGFRGMFGELDTRFNSFVTPYDANPGAEGTILHFLDRPKPWDPAYQGRLCRTWFMRWYRLATCIGADDALALYRLTTQG
jgi:lipopolysaccharide biosynthesis glycosyltransferase